MDLLQLIFGLAILAVTITLPGYFLTLGFFPRKKELEELERFAYSFVFSITFLPLLVLVENQLFGIPIDSTSTAASVLFFIAAGIAIWKYRIMSGKIGKDEAVQFWIPKISFK